MGALEKRVPECLKWPKTTYTIIATAEKQSKKSKKGPFSLYIGSPGSHPGDGINGGPEGKVPPAPPPPPVSPAMGSCHVVIKRCLSLRGIDEEVKLSTPVLFDTSIMNSAVPYIRFVIFRTRR